ncbi:MAG: hypothetical protein JW871_00155 [Endomicrobiales bacterium]|nr:hypothetical protein [Endomicrobiales bacterium]
MELKQIALIFLSFSIFGCATVSKTNIAENEKTVRINKREIVKEIKLVRELLGTDIVEILTLKDNGKIIRTKTGSGVNSDKKTITQPKEDFRTLVQKLKDKGGFKQELIPTKTGESLLTKILIVTEKKQEVIYIKGDLPTNTREVYKDLMALRQKVLSMN